ncbi:CENPF protein, partial [Piaya cayana]|nr:CENPF protein [Piaya cayana]
MSCAVEEWKEGPFSRVLQNIHELENQVVTFKRVCHIKQLQLRSLGAALQNRGRRLKNQGSMDLCDSLEIAKQKTSHDLQLKEPQVSIQSGQLNFSKKDIKRLEQELKR